MVSLNIDWSFFTSELFTQFVLKGLIFSVVLTLVATLGGVVFGTLLALMRLSGKKWLVLPATIYVNGMRSIPLVMVILWFFLLVPLVIAAWFGMNNLMPLSPNYGGTVAAFGKILYLWERVEESMLQGAAAHDLIGHLE